jgi:hypothetical protein
LHNTPKNGSPGQAKELIDIPNTGRDSGGGDQPATYRGRWEGNDTFVADLDTAGNRESFVLRMQFDGDRLEFTAREGTHAQGFTVERRPLN